MTTPDPRPVTALRNMGPAMARVCADAGLHTVGDLATLGSDDAYARILASGHRPHFMAYLALAMGLQGRDIFDCRTTEKEDMRARFDRVAAGAAARGDDLSGLEAELDRIGVRPPPVAPAKPPRP